MNQLTTDELNFGLDAIYSYFSAKVSDPNIVRFLTQLDVVDSWTVDRKSSAQDEKVSYFLRKLKSVVEQDANLLHELVPDFLEVISYLTTSRCLYIIDVVTAVNPKFSQALYASLETAEKNVNLIIIQRRLEAIRKGLLFSKIYSNNRLALISKIMRGYEDE